jgi:hypothetical protein
MVEALPWEVIQPSQQPSTFEIFFCFFPLSVFFKKKVQTLLEKKTIKKY